MDGSKSNLNAIELGMGGLFEALSGEDDLGVVIRASIHMEYELDKFIAIVLPNPRELKLNNFSLRLKVALACGLRNDLKKPLQILSGMRNNFAHELNTKLNDKHVVCLFESLSLLERQTLVFSCAAMKSIGPTPLYENFKFDDRLRLILTVLWCAIVTERQKLERNRRPGRRSR